MNEPKQSSESVHQNTPPSGYKTKCSCRLVLVAAVPLVPDEDDKEEIMLPIKWAQQANKFENSEKGSTKLTKINPPG